MTDKEILKNVEKELNEHPIETKGLNRYEMDGALKIEDDYFEFEIHNSYGKDIYLELELNGNDKIEDLLTKLKDRIEYFDITDECTPWLDSLGRRGVPNSILELVDSAKVELNVYKDLYFKIAHIVEDCAPEKYESLIKEAYRDEHAEKLVTVLEPYLPKHTQNIFADNFEVKRNEDFQFYYKDLNEAKECGVMCPGTDNDMVEVYAEEPITRGTVVVPWFNHLPYSKKVHVNNVLWGDDRGITGLYADLPEYRESEKERNEKQWEPAKNNKQKEQEIER